MSGMRATSPMKADLARQIRTTAGKVDGSHPETVAGQHLRKAATLVQSGQHDGAKRHLDAAMELMTPRNLIRHGITDDEGHATAKMAMHQINVHRLGVQDVQDTEARNEQQVQHKRDTAAQVLAARQAKTQQAAAVKQQQIEQRTAARPTGTGPGSQPQTGPAPGPILAAGSQPAVELAFNPAEPRGRGGKWIFEGKSSFTYPGPPGSFEHARAVDRYADNSQGLPGDARTLIRQANKAMMARDIPTALSRLAGARWHDANFGDGLHLADIDAIGASFRKVPGTAGVRNGPSSPIARGQEHPGTYREQKGAVVGYANSGPAVELSARTAMLERTPAPYGKPGGPGLYGKAGNKHSDYFEQVVQALMRKRGMDKAQASRIAWGALRKWRRGGGHVHPEVMAAAGKALGQEAAAGARAHSHAADPWETADRLIELACVPFDLAGYNPAEARVPAGQAGGGRFGGQGGQGGKGSRAQRRAKLVKQAVTLRGEITALLTQIHSATHHRSKSSTPRKKGAASTSAKAAAAGKAAASKASTPAKASTKAAAKTMTLAQMRTKLAELRQQLRTVMGEIHQLANEERAAIELASGYSQAWRHELRGPHGQFVASGGGARTQRSAARRAMVSGPSSALRPPRARSLHAQAGAAGTGTGLHTDDRRHSAEIDALTSELRSKTAEVQESAAQDAEQRARAAATATHHHLEQVEQNLDRIEAKKHKQKLVIHVMALVAGAILTYLAAKLGTPELLTANLAPGALTIQELIDWRKRL